MANRRQRQGGGGRKPRRLWLPIAVVFVVLMLLALAPTIWAWTVARPHEYSVETVSEQRVALVLGASVKADGNPSDFLAGRLAVAQQLYQAGKVRAILVSGDNGSKGYDEPTAMKNWLVTHGVPAEHIVTDFAGFDTYDSCVRAVKIFDAHDAIVVTQSYHLHRALATCRSVGLTAVGVGDSSVKNGNETWQRGVVRELGAVWKTWWDVGTHREPTLGEPEDGIAKALGEK
ncbi:MAG: SanA/YdcF family protein [Propionibacteriaceae bacterium]